MKTLITFLWLGACSILHGQVLMGDDDWRTELNKLIILANDCRSTLLNDSIHMELKDDGIFVQYGYTYGLNKDMKMAWKVKTSEAFHVNDIDLTNVDYVLPDPSARVNMPMIIYKCKSGDCITYQYGDDPEEQLDAFGLQITCERDKTARLKDQWHRFITVARWEFGN